MFLYLYVFGLSWSATSFYGCSCLTFKCLQNTIGSVVGRWINGLLHGFNDDDVISCNYEKRL